MAGTAAGDSQLFEDVFTLTRYDQSKYDRVARIWGESPDKSTVISLDVNVELFPCSTGENLHVVLATSLSLESSGSGGGGGGGAGGSSGAGSAAKDEEKGWRDLARSSEATLADTFDYVCYGKIYKFE